MIACSGCGFEAPEDFAFCPKCGGALAVPPAVHEERKVVTTLFCDLVGFTAMSEGADPEDVDAVLGAYHEAARKVIESHGGTVEKFIGDAVVGVFGVPAAHEDDAERAVRAGLRILEALEGVTRPDGAPLEARCGVNTGEALVRLDVDPASGRGFLTGDAVNTAARLQAAAPPCAVAVGTLTHELTQRVIDYEELPPVAAKGKAEPVAAWRAVAPVARRGIDADARGFSPFVGREGELAYLAAIFEKVAAQSAPQFVLLVGEPGIGKSRLVRELLGYVDARPMMTTWRQGYCPPFGEDVTYWALSEIVKAHAGIRDTDGLATVEVKLDTILPRGPDGKWLTQRLRALVGLDAPDASREENFTAWMRLFEEVAASRPTVLVFEDLHWADDALLAFVEFLATHLASVPLMIVGTARPGLFVKHADFASDGRVNRIGLEPLSSEETAQLAGALLSGTGVDPTVVNQVIERCGGNPFYAEQSARLMADAERTAQLPDSVQAVIAARLDTLPLAQKAVLGDAAVVGAAFWDGAITAMGDRAPADVEAALSGLQQSRLIRRVRESTMEGEREYVFAHALAREVVYGQLTRSVRSQKHWAVADWLHERTREMTRDLAELLAFHLATAFDLAQAVHDADQAGAVAPLAAGWLKRAGDAAQPVDVAAAKRHYERGLAMVTSESQERLGLLVGLGEALLLTGEYHAAAERLEQAMNVALETNDDRRAVKSMLRLAFVRESMGIASKDLERKALALAREMPPSDELIEALDVWAYDEWLRTGDPQKAATILDEAFALCDEHGLTATPFLLSTRGALRCVVGDLTGLDDYRRALELAQNGPAEKRRGFEVARLMADYGILVDQTQGPSASLKAFRDSIEFFERRGMLADALITRGAALEARLTGGDWTGLLADADSHVEALLKEAVALVPFTRAVICLLRAWLGSTDDLEELIRFLETRQGTSTYLYEEAYASVAAATALRALGRIEASAGALQGWANTPQPVSTVEYAWMVPEAIRTALCSRTDLAESLRHRADGPLPVQCMAKASVDNLLAEAHGERQSAAVGFADAAKRWHRFGVPYEEGQALLGHGRCLLALDRAREAATPLAAAREIFARLGARPALAETDDWLARTSRA